MPQWLFDFCIQVCLLFGSVISIAGLCALVAVVAIEIYDAFTGDDNLEEWTEDDLE